MITKPNKDIEVPPFDRIYQNRGGCAFNHQFEWVITPMKQYRQEICKKCGVSGKTEKLDVDIKQNIVHCPDCGATLELNFVKHNI
jgi:hypothetical protein